MRGWSVAIVVGLAGGSAFGETMPVPGQTRWAQSTGDTPAACLRYSDRLTLAGTLTRRTFPGAPNFESVARGDQPETVLVLNLTKPICMAKDDSEQDGINAAIPRITAVQLDTVERKLGVGVGQTVRVSGSVFGAHTGHHHTPIVMTDVTLETAR